MSVVIQLKPSRVYAHLSTPSSLRRPNPTPAPNWLCLYKQIPRPLWGRCDLAASLTVRQIGFVSRVSVAPCSSRKSFSKRQLAPVSPRMNWLCLYNGSSLVVTPSGVPINALTGALRTCLPNWLCFARSLLQGGLSPPPAWVGDKLRSAQRGMSGPRTGSPRNHPRGRGCYMDGPALADRPEHVAQPPPAGCSPTGPAKNLDGLPYRIDYLTSSIQLPEDHTCVTIICQAKSRQSRGFCPLSSDVIKPCPAGTYNRRLPTDHYELL